MIVIVAEFYTDGDFSINAEHAGLAHKYGSHHHCGTFLCDNKADAENTLLYLFESIECDNNYISSWLIRTFAEALNILRDDSGTLRLGWSAFLGGNYSNTHLFMQTYEPRISMDGITGE